MSEEAIRLSVVIPVYNAEDTVRETLDSVLGQSLKEIEVICVDDGSTDRSADVIREYAARDRRVSLIRQQNRYAGAARNAGIDAAKGTYLFFLDADDSVLDFALEAVCAKAEKHGLDCLRFQSLILDEKGKRYMKDPWTGGGLLRPGNYDRLLKARKDSPLLRVSVAPWSGICRRAFVLEKNCRFNSLRCVNDRSFYNKIITCADRIMITRDRVTVHRVNRDQSLIGTKAAHFDCQIASLKLTEQQLKEDGVLPETAEAVMTQEYLDLAVWYRRFAGTPERRAEMDRQIGEYLDGGETAYGALLREQLEKLPAPAAPPEEIHPFHEPAREPSVTVLVPVRNGAEAPDRALRSLTDQTLEEAEFLLLYAGGKNDLSLKLIREYSVLDRRFIPVDCSGADGYGQMMNRGLEQARGQYVGILDPEDCADGELCRRLREKAEKRGPDPVRRRPLPDRGGRNTADTPGRGGGRESVLPPGVPGGERDPLGRRHRPGRERLSGRGAVRRPPCMPAEGTPGHGAGRRRGGTVSRRGSGSAGRGAGAAGAEDPHRKPDDPGKRHRFRRGLSAGEAQGEPDRTEKRSGAKIILADKGQTW